VLRDNLNNFDIQYLLAKQTQLISLQRNGQICYKTKAHRNCRRYGLYLWFVVKPVKVGFTTAQLFSANGVNCKRLVSYSLLYMAHTEYTQY